MGKVLIVRSASFQQLDANLPNILGKFPGMEVHLLTHEHGSALAGKYSDVQRVLIYPVPSRFQKGTRVPEISPGAYEAVVALVSNMTGAGFVNVLEFAISLGAGKVYRCNLVGEIEEIGERDLSRIVTRDRVNRAVALAVGILLGVPAALWFLGATGVASLRGKTKD